MQLMGVPTFCVFMILTKFSVLLYTIQIEDADLSDIIAGKHESEALRVLEIVCNSLAGRKLKSIDLSDNALGEKVSDAYCVLIRLLRRPVGHAPCSCTSSGHQCVPCGPGAAGGARALLRQQQRPVGLGGQGGRRDPDLPRAHQAASAPLL